MEDNNLQNSENFVYVVFTATPCKMGRFIRIMTRGVYNHSSLALSPDLEQLYSFARYHQNAAFFAGFVVESCLRYQNKNKVAKVKMCKIPVSEEQLREIKDYFALLENNDKYRYNLISAACALSHSKIELDNSYTCIEFVVHVLERFSLHDGIDSSKYYAIKDVENILQDNLYYEGDFVIPENAKWGNDKFPIRLSVKNAISNTFGNCTWLFRKLARKSSVICALYAWRIRHG